MPSLLVRMFSMIEVLTFIQSLNKIILMLAVIRMIVVPYWTQLRHTLTALKLQAD